MAHPIIETCPVCAHQLHVSKLSCANCHTVIENDFTLSKFAAFTPEQIHFIEVFLLKRGNIKEVEKALGVSYPTVRGKLNDIVTMLGHQSAIEQDNRENKANVMEQLENGEIDVKEALALLKNKDRSGE